MRVRDLPLSASYVDHFVERGVRELYPPQAAAVDAGVCEGSNVVAAIPTASGKTFIAQLGLLTADGPGLYVCPLRALAREKYESFASLPGLEVGISTGDFDASGDDLAGNDVIVATSEKVDSAIRNGASWVDELACVVVDEVHLLDAERRGPTLEVTIATLRRQNPDVQVVALSATVDNPEAIAGWLDATLIESDWRPVDLRSGVAVGGSIAFDDGTTREVPVGGPAGPNGCDDAGDASGGGDVSGDTGPDDTEVTAALVADTVAEGGQCLAFVRSRAEAVSLAERLADDGLAVVPRQVDERVVRVDDAPGTRIQEQEPVVDTVEHLAVHHPRQPVGTRHPPPGRPYRTKTVHSGAVDESGDRVWAFCESRPQSAHGGPSHERRRHLRHGDTRALRVAVDAG